jgi:hypothetical protein
MPDGKVIYPKNAAPFRNAFGLSVYCSSHDTFAKKRKSLFYRPSFGKSGHKRAASNAKFFGPLGERLFLAFIGKNSVVCFVVGLFFSGTPSAIAGRIPQGIFDAVNGHTIWTLTQVSKECREVLSPTVTDKNSDSAIPSILLAIRVMTPIQDASPCMIGRGKCISMLGNSGSTRFSPIASAGFGQATTQGFPSGGYRVSAVAGA